MDQFNGGGSVRHTHLRDIQADTARDIKDGGREHLMAELPASDSSNQSDGASEDHEAQEPTDTIDKSVLAIPAPKRIRAPEHLKWVATLPCLICQRRPSDAHHLKRVQPNAMGRKPGDQWVVTLCRIHHMALHEAGDENRWWQTKNLDPIARAEELWTARN